MESELFNNAVIQSNPNLYAMHWLFILTIMVVFFALLVWLFKQLFKMHTRRIQIGPLGILILVLLISANTVGLFFGFLRIVELIVFRP